jgi:hypothetical protein
MAFRLFLIHLRHCDLPFGLRRTTSIGSLKLIIRLLQWFAQSSNVRGHEAQEKRQMALLASVQMSEEPSQVYWNVEM